jgi:ubiquitin carboxyl-terminal hydrolase 22/27/51
MKRTDVDGPYIGLRPLLNLSQTCFLSAILQALIHNPLLKSYFLSDKHNRHVCPNGSKGLAVGKPYIGIGGQEGDMTDREKGCMCCEMDRAFEEVCDFWLLARQKADDTWKFHNEDKSPFGPVTMLYAMWHASAELEGHGQQGEFRPLPHHNSLGIRLIWPRCPFILPRRARPAARPRKRAALKL